jgi:hypothetical protein
MTMAERAESAIPAEADIDRAPGLLDGATSLELTSQTWAVARVALTTECFGPSLL